MRNSPGIRYFTLLVAGMGLILGAMSGAPALLTAAEKSGATNWPQWRGPDSNGVATDANLPTEWSATQNVLWKTEIPGRGHSSPIVWGNRIFLTTAIEGEVVPGAKAPIHIVETAPGKKEAWSHPQATGADKKHTLKVLCLDRDTGKVLWERTVYEGTMYDSRHAKASYASPTPVTDGKTVYFYFGTEGLYAFDFSGNLKWKTSMEKIGSQSVGIGTSPILYGNLVLIQADNEDGADSCLVAFDKKSGKEAWRTPRKNVEISWATPIIVKAKDHDELVTSGNQAIITYDPKTGKELWRAQGLDSNAVPSSVSGNDLVYIFTGFPKKKVLAVRPGGSGDITGTPNIVWTYEKGVAYVASPVLYGEYLYLVSDKGILTCLDAKTGEVKYQDGRVPTPAFFMASLVAADGKILQFSEDGDTYVIKAGPQHQILSKNSLGENIYATPAIAAGRIFIRGEKNLYAIGTSAKLAGAKAGK